MLTATAQLATDRAWLGAAENGIGPASRRSARPPMPPQFIEMFTKMGGLMAERVTDLKDIRDRVIAELAGLPAPGVPEPVEPSILFAEDLAPADTAGLDPHRIVGLATSLGGPTSHTAIIARQLGIPCVVAVKGLDGIPAGTMVLIDGSRGAITVDPRPGDAAAAVAAGRRRGRRDGPGGPAPAPLPTVYAVAILANVADGSAARAARRAPVEGVGLFRTELCFLDAETSPAWRRRPTSTPRCWRPSPGTRW